MPATMVDTEVIRDAVRLACRAPSLHNSQPWRWVVEGDTVSALRRRGPGRPGHGQLGPRGADRPAAPCSTTSGWQWPPPDTQPMWTDFPTPTTFYMWLRSTSAPMEYVTDGHRQRANAILLRRTDRLPFAAPPTGMRSSRQLRDTVDSDAVRLDVDPRRSASAAGRSVSAHRVAASLRFVVSRRTRMVDSSFRGLRGYSAQLTGIGGRERPRRRRTYVPGDPSSRAQTRSRRRPCQGLGVVDVRRHAR